MRDSPCNAVARLPREKQTIQAMMQVYCRAHHATKGSLCVQCQSLYDYALGRLDRCPFGAEKTTCARCPTHCYKPAMRARIKAVMRYAGRRMFFRHPVLALRHLLDTFGRPGRDSGHAN
ncbi:MAG: nitrous oxide-stimulated promoter family protein [Isosphaeraceae bacterium]